MSAIPARILGAVTAAALVIAPVTFGGLAGAAAAASHRDTYAMFMADVVGDLVRQSTQEDGVDGRSISEVRAVVLSVTIKVDDLMRITVTGLTDLNHDGLDDDGKIKVRGLSNVAILSLHKNGSYSVADGGFVFKNRLSVLKESAQAFDRLLGFQANGGIVDPWDMSLIKEIKTEMPTGVRVVSDYDGNQDGYDDDGRLTFLANSKAVTLTIGNTDKQVGKVTYGPTWKTKAPIRTHHPVAPPY